MRLPILIFFSVVLCGCERSDIATHMRCADFRIETQTLTGSPNALNWTVKATGCGRTSYFACSGDRFHPTCTPTTEKKARTREVIGDPVVF